jgi:hypothetical protein
MKVVVVIILPLTFVLFIYDIIILVLENMKSVVIMNYKRAREMRSM